MRKFVARHAGVRYDEKNDWLVQQFSFPNRQQTERFVRQVMRLSNKLWHHPHIHIGWTTVTLTLRTHDSNGVTKKDFEFFDALQGIVATAGKMKGKNKLLKKKK